MSDMTKTYYKFVEYVKVNGIKGKIITFDNGDSGYDVYLVNKEGVISKLATVEGLESTDCCEIVEAHTIQLADIETRLDGVDEVLDYILNPPEDEVQASE